MSLILEALKKSEQQRQREKAPSLQSIHQPVAMTEYKAARPWWLFAVFIVICNLVVFGYWFWHQQNTVAQQVQPASAPASTVQAPVANPSRTVNADVAESRESPQAEFTQISPRQGAVRAIPEEPVQRVEESGQRIEEIGELPDNVRNNLPAMTFSFHVYSESPEQRTIIINDRRMREGDEISAGLKLQSITSDGIVLLFEQHRIHISVLSDW